MKEVKEIENKYDHISLHICIKFAKVKINSFKVPIFVSLTLFTFSFTSSYPDSMSFHLTILYFTAFFSKVIRCIINYFKTL